MFIFLVRFISSETLVFGGTSTVIEKVEKTLDGVLGLATSEPTRKAILTMEQSAFIHGEMEPVALADNSPVLEKTIRSLRLREKTGVSIVAIYRDGKHISNPSPDLSFITHDILIVIGNTDERRKAKELLLEKSAMI